MSASIWIWQFMKPVTPEQATSAVTRAQLSEDWIPEVPFAEVAIRAVGKTKAKRTSEPGLVLWTAANGSRWFADLTAGEMHFERPRSKTAKAIMVRLDDARHLQPSDLSDYMEAMVTGWGAIQLMGPLWIVPNVDGIDSVLTMIRSMPGAAVAAIPIQDSDVAGEILALLAGRMQAESEHLQDGVDKLKPESIRRRAAELRSRAEDVAKLADLYETDMTALGAPILDAEASLLAKLPGRYYPAPLDFTGIRQEQDRQRAESTGATSRKSEVATKVMSQRAAAAKPIDTPRPQAIVTRGEIPPGGDRTDGRTIARVGDPPPSAPVLRGVREVEID